jgi:hypothetical protein
MWNWQGSNATWTHFVFYSLFVIQCLLKTTHTTYLYIEIIKKQWKESDAAQNEARGTFIDDKIMMWCTFFDRLFLCFSLQTPVKKWSKQSLILTTIHLWSFVMPPHPHKEWLRPSWPWPEAGTAFMLFCSLCVSHKAQWVSAGHSREVFQIKSVK